MSLHFANTDLKTLESLHTFLRLRAREHLGDRGGVGLRLLRELRMGMSEAKAYPERRATVMNRFQRLALAYSDHADFDDAWVLPSPDARVFEAIELLMNHRGVDIGTATQLLTAYAEVARCELVDAANVVVSAHAGEDNPSGIAPA